MPLLDIQQRFRELGRIRLGEKGNKGQPQKRDTFRLTSPSKDILAAAQAIYGGELRPCDPKGTLGGQYELDTPISSIDVMLPPRSAGEAYSQWYELWSGGGCDRRCDGTTEWISGEGCVCKREDYSGPECKPTTRLNVIIPALPSVGTWRLETHGWNAAKELTGTVNLLAAADAAGRPLRAILRLEQRRSRQNGQTRRFVVPVLDIPQTINELLGGAELPQIAAPQARQLTTSQPPLPEEIETPGQAVEAEQPAGASELPIDAAPAPATRPSTSQVEERYLYARGKGWTDDAVDDAATDFGGKTPMVMDSDEWRVFATAVVKHGPSTESAVPPAEEAAIGRAASNESTAVPTSEVPTPDAAVTEAAGDSPSPAASEPPLHGSPEYRGWFDQQPREVRQKLRAQGLGPSDKPKNVQPAEPEQITVTM